VTSQGAASVFAMHRASRTTGEIAEYVLDAIRTDIGRLPSISTESVRRPGWPGRG